MLIKLYKFLGFTCVLTSPRYIKSNSILQTQYFTVTSKSFNITTKTPSQAKNKCIYTYKRINLQSEHKSVEESSAVVYTCMNQTSQFPEFLQGRGWQFYTSTAWPSFWQKKTSTKKQINPAHPKTVSFFMKVVQKSLSNNKLTGENGTIEWLTCPCLRKMSI